MTTMEFDEMKKIWDTQNNEPLYVLNENAFNNQILLKKRKATHLTNLTEVFTIAVNFAAGAFVAGVNLINGIINTYLYLLAAWMFFTAIGVTIGRVRRIRGQRKFDRSILGDLDYAIATASYQVSLSGILRWNILPMSVFTVLGVWYSGESVTQTAAIAIFLAVSYYASSWEHNYYKKRKKEVETLKRIALSE